MAHPPDRQTTWVALAASVALGVALRVGALLAAPPVGIDEARYLVTAHHLRAGLGYSDWNGPEVDIQPLLPLLTAILGTDPASLELRGRLVACLAACAALPILAWLALLLTGPRATLLFVLMLAVHPWLVREAGVAQPESLYIALVGAALIALHAAAERAWPAWPWMGAGALFGLAYLARPEGLLIALFAGGFALLGEHGRPGRIRAGWLPGLLCVLLVASPHLLFLRRTLGGWALTGKDAEVFFIGQAMHAAGGEPPMTEAYLALLERYGDVGSFVLAHPLDVLLRAGRFAGRILFFILPRGLGLAGLAGWAVCCASSSLRARLPRRILVLAPALSLPLMVLACPEERVIATSLPFLLIPAAEGFAGLWERCQGLSRRRAIAASGLVLVLVLSGWVPPVWRVARGGGLPREPPEKIAARSARLAAGPGGIIATNSPVISFYVADASLFGPAGRYRPLGPEPDCAFLEAELRRRGSRVAVLDRPRGGARGELEATGACALRQALLLTTTGGERELQVMVMPGANGESVGALPLSIATPRAR